MPREKELLRSLGTPLSFIVTSVSSRFASSNTESSRNPRLENNMPRWLRRSKKNVSNRRMAECAIRRKWWHFIRYGISSSGQEQIRSIGTLRTLSKESITTRPHHSFKLPLRPAKNDNRTNNLKKTRYSLCVQVQACNIILRIHAIPYSQITL